MTQAPLPDPWRVRSTLDPEMADTLEAAVGSRLTIADLDRDVDLEAFGADGFTPRTDRAMLVMGRRWIEVENVDTDLIVFLRLQLSLGPTSSIHVSAVIFPFSEGNDLTGSDLRGLPIAAFNAAFTTHEQQGRANLRIALALGQEISGDPLSKLPAASASDAFSARIARQYMAIERSDPSQNVAKQMASLNSVPLPSIQRWIARARKQGFLPPAMPPRGG